MAYTGHTRLQGYENTSEIAFQGHQSEIKFSITCFLCQFYPRLALSCFSISQEKLGNIDFHLITRQKQEQHFNVNIKVKENISIVNNEALLKTLSHNYFLLNIYTRKIPDFNQNM